ncbi:MULTISPECIES: ABC transporter ATP-binding protein [Bosea]|uniref:ABC transporter ATP-binding protein n=1 Tax=Bosea TaxID=85413 RepID=UPI0021501C35|nr:MULTISPECIES: ABC transporter ATP-binding protein [Bosea]MCR4523934.1 ABC transporter ATP-binding protein [Bosea sp. 47.2.35]MDR6830593.1 branched-chain amino acid transport system ATP-binding protein [Bosea robiniae]MDR6897474.1 branched-chain amino acid transport system ATP-binding protein [Bosea sp. BE109]MDR7140871.1 branched-chain amino acid transport system ATP-binding protein [Bosea sp. BE168]MDR7177386.1 branched-chain amino acid transport system ATP-binding protein [Bosea sp. BE271
MLSVRNLQSAYGRSQVLFDVALDIAEGEVVTLLGRNGMGKTTTVRSIMGLLAPKGGDIRFESQDVRGIAPEKIARCGIGLVPEGRQVFPTLSVRENLVATASNRLKRSSPWTLERVYTLFPRLQERAGQSARTLSGGEQQMLAVGRALMTNPKLLILDEATEGLAPVIRAEIWGCIEALKAQGQSILLIDKNINVLKRIADRHYIIEKGRTVWSGSSTDLAANAELVHRYVGV